MQFLSKNRTRVTSEIILGMTFLAYGCTIYLLFRTKNLNIYQWCSAIELTDIVDNLRLIVEVWKISDFTRYSLPDGLYNAAYILIVDAIWHDDNRLIKFIIISFVPFVSISSEVLQFFGLVKGTFDTYDLMCYAIPPLLYLLIKTYKI